MSPSGPTPFMRVVRGDPTPEEAAALVAVLTARAKAAAAARDTAEQAAGRSASAWRDRARLMRRTPQPGPNAWRASFHPG